jgi:glycogen debranching enzyme
MEKVAEVHEPFPVLATSSPADDRTLVLKQGDTFAVCDHYGDIRAHGLGEQGLYHRGTRFLSRLELRLGAQRPLFLSSTVKRGNDVLVVDLTNPDTPLGAAGAQRIEGALLPRGMLHLFRARFLWDGSCHERIRVANHGLEPVRVSLTVAFSVDFADVFEVRGTVRSRRGVMLPSEVEESVVALGYRGLDGVARHTRIGFDPAPASLSGAEARFDLRLEPQTFQTVTLVVGCGSEASPARVTAHDEAWTAAQASRACAHEARPRVVTSNIAFNDWLDRSLADLQMMMTQTRYGPYPYAGVPWFSTPFGRDGILTALEMLWMEPEVARGVLSFLAAHQASESRPEQDAEPGKILHEAREGEMAALGEVPFGQYYGSVDATPLFVALAAAYHERTGDRAFALELWPHVDRALGWIDHHGDLDQDGFVEYSRRSADGLQNQGWKDSHDSVFHADGALATGPIALCEVQAYVYAARLGAARLATVLGLGDRAGALLARAEDLRRAFEDRFWDEELGTYALALDGEKRPCRVRTSNAGHALFCGIAGRERAARTAQALLGDTSFSGWGVRTVDACERRYNPMSYHNGSVWPHDNALVAAGLGRYGLKDGVLRILEGLFDASGFMDLSRMPELFCGFKRRADEGPTLYPVACAPQSWAAGAVLMLLQAALGLTIDAPGRQVIFSRPALPELLKTVHLQGLRVGPATVDIVVERHAHDVGITVARRQGDVEIVTIK